MTKAANDLMRDGARGTAGIARILAERVCACGYDDLPREAIEWSRTALLDTLGVALAGAHEEAPRILARVLEAEGRTGACLVLGTRARVPQLDAAAINGTAAHALDFDNATNTMFGHASATVYPALLAAAKVCGAGGRDLLAAHVAGFEVGARLGRGTNMHHYRKGWHPTSTLGVFAVAAACARLLGLSVKQTGTALAVSASLAAGIKANFGTMTKPLHVGQCARSGLLAALLARDGYTANPAALEHEQGFLSVYNGEGRFDVQRIVEGWGDPYDIVSPGACYKQYPCCASTHPAIDAALSLVREHGRFDPASMQRVDTRTSEPRLAHTDRPRPASDLEAKFSVQYCVARALLDGDVVFEHFERDAWRSPEVQTLMPRVHSAAYAPDEFPGGNLLGAAVAVTLRDGTRYAAKVDQPVGRTSACAIEPERMIAKFRRCAGRVLDDAAAQAVFDIVGAIEAPDAVPALMRALETGAREPREDGAHSAAL